VVEKGRAIERIMVDSSSLKLCKPTLHIGLRTHIRTGTAVHTDVSCWLIQIREEVKKQPLPSQKVA
jgi:hypothetical protein